MHYVWICLDLEGPYLSQERSLEVIRHESGEEELEGGEGEWGSKGNGARERHHGIDGKDEDEDGDDMVGGSGWVWDVGW